MSTYRSEYLGTLFSLVFSYILPIFKCSGELYSVEKQYIRYLSKKILFSSKLFQKKSFLLKKSRSAVVTVC